MAKQHLLAKTGSSLRSTTTSDPLWILAMVDLNLTCKISFAVIFKHWCMLENAGYMYILSNTYSIGQSGTCIELAERLLLGCLILNRILHTGGGSSVPMVYRATKGKNLCCTARGSEVAAEEAELQKPILPLQHRLLSQAE